MSHKYVLIDSRGMAKKTISMLIDFDPRCIFCFEKQYVILKNREKYKKKKYIELNVPIEQALLSIYHYDIKWQFLLLSVWIRGSTMSQLMIEVRVSCMLFISNVWSIDINEILIKKDVTQHLINNTAVTLIIYSFCQIIHELLDCPSETCALGLYPFSF